MSESTLSPSARIAAVADAIKRLDKQHGPNTVMRLGDAARAPVAGIPTGSLGLDRATGCGGYPRGRIVEIYGAEASGKTTLSLHAIAECQASGGTAAFIDAEHAFDPIYAEKLGVDLDALLVSQPDHGEQAMDVVEKLVESCGVDLLVVDSVAALTPRVELEGDMGDQQVGLQARLMSKGMRKLAGVVNRTGACVIFINQLRQKIGVMFGPTTTTTGGNALKYYCSLRLEVKRIGSLKNGEEIIGNRTRVKTVKNKLAPPFRVVEFDLRFGEGISAEGELIELAEERGLITRSGAWYRYGDQRIGQGRENARAWLQANAAARDTLRGLLTTTDEAVNAPTTSTALATTASKTPSKTPSKKVTKTTASTKSPVAQA
jgi:recombination protein RecA